MRKTKLFIALAAALGTQTVMACEIEDWRYLDTAGPYFEIEGTTTCRQGMISIRAYDGDENWLGNASGFITGHSFSALVESEVPDTLNIKYSFTEY